MLTGRTDMKPSFTSALCDGFQGRDSFPSRKQSSPFVTERCISLVRLWREDLVQRWAKAGFLGGDKIRI